MTGNHFLNGLAEDDRRAVLEVLKPVALTAGEVLIDQDTPVTTVHFPTTAWLSNITLTPGGRSLQTAMIGREGLSGLAPFMADMDCAWQVSCESSGVALAGSAAQLRDLAGRRPGLMAQFLTLTHFYQAQANQLAVCNAFHRIDGRLARWLLTAHDLTGRTRLFINQEEIAARLGVQRTSVVSAFVNLKREGLVHHQRGWLEIRDQGGLKKHACSCYARIHDLAVEIDVLPGRAA